MEKIGLFEWILDFEDFRYVLESENRRRGINIELASALVLGCGTSTLSLSVADMGYSAVVSIDNDEGCVKYMSTRPFPQKNLYWLKYDLAEPHRYQAASYLIDDRFSLIIDKGTLDAILVEGSVSTTLSEIHRMLHFEGFYMLCSLHNELLLAPLLGCDELGFNVEFHKVLSRSNMSQYYTIAICSKKVKFSILDINALQIREKGVMDNYYRQLDPLLTETMEEFIKHQFSFAYQALYKEENTRFCMETVPVLTAEAKTIFPPFPPFPMNSELSPSALNENITVKPYSVIPLDGGIRLPIPVVYKAFFCTDSRDMDTDTESRYKSSQSALQSLGYSMDLFLEDLQTHPLQVIGYMSCSELISFLREKQ